MRRAVFGLVIFPAMIAASCGDNATTGGPAGPSSPTVTSVTVTGTLTLSNLGQTSQLTATAHFAKGTTQDVTGQAMWSSSDSTIAVVSPAGLVTATGVGMVTIAARYQNVTGSTRVTVTRPPAYTLSGVVTESVPTTSTMLSGARVEFTDGVNQGRFATTDSTGHYQIAQVPGGTYTVRATMSGYVDSTRQVAVNSNLTVDFALAPTPASTWFKFSGTLSGSNPVCYQTYPCQVFNLPPIHNAGSFYATLLATSIANVSVQLFNADTGQVVASASGSGAASQVVSAQIQTPGNYQLRVVAISIAGAAQIQVNVTACPN